jgi:hypothetical protein
MDNATSLQRVLDAYCQNSGQMVSVAKSSIFFSPNTNVLVRADICEVLHIDTEALFDKYLGLPALVGADRLDCFMHFVDRIIQRIMGWKEKLLSIGGKEMLIKAVAQCIPVYAMSVFKIPIGVCKRIADVIAQFWWGGEEENKKCTGIHGGSYVFLNTKVEWVSEICTPLIRRCLLNNVGDFLMNLSLYVQKCFGLNIIRMGIF